VAAAKVRERLAVLDRRLGQAERTDEDRLGVGPGDAVHAVEEDAEGGRLRGLVQEVLHEREVEDLLEVCEVVRDRVHDGDLSWAVGGLADLREVDLSEVHFGSFGLSIRISNR
jgi:hypothetical protein